MGGHAHWLQVLAEDLVKVVGHAIWYISRAHAEGRWNLNQLIWLLSGWVVGALLFLPNMTRAFFVVVMSSGAAAAIGVTDGISVILRQAELLPSLGGRLVLFAIGIVMFGVPLQLGFAFIRWLQRALGSHMARKQTSTP